MRILLVEDNEGEQLIMQEAFNEARVTCTLDMVKNGEEALKFLKHEGPFKDVPKPDLIILDLNLPRKNGQEVLAEIRATPKLEHIPVIILSNSRSPRDVCQCYSLRANAYVSKPSGFQGFVTFAQMIQQFWVGLVSYCSHS